MKVQRGASESIGLSTVFETIDGPQDLRYRRPGLLARQDIEPFQGALNIRPPY
jgi:hypothetical protein